MKPIFVLHQIDDGAVAWRPLAADHRRCLCLLSKRTWRLTLMPPQGNSRPQISPVIDVVTVPRQSVHPCNLHTDLKSEGPCTDEPRLDASHRENELGGAQTGMD